MSDRSSINLINQTSRTRRVAIALILLALALPSLFAWSDNVPFGAAGEFTGKLAGVTLLAFALVLLGWSGYVSRIAHEERVSAAAPASSMPARIPDRADR